MPNLTFGRKLTLAFILAALLILALTASGHYAIIRLNAVDQDVKHSQEVRRLLSDLLSGYQDAETGQRGYLLTHQEAFLEPYKSGLKDILRVEGELAALVSEDTAQRRRLEALRKLGAGRLAILDRTMQSRQDYLSISSETKRHLQDGLISMRLVRDAIAGMDSAEESLLNSRREDARQSAILAKQVMLSGALCSLSLLALIGWWILHSLHRKVGLAVQQLGSSSAELQVVAAQQASGAGQQASSMTEISTTLTELLVTSTQIAQAAEEVSNISVKVTDATGEGIATVQDSGQAFHSIQNHIGLIVNQMLDLDRTSAQIGSVAGVVAELAEQTNILAINATIEAAGSGSIGVRFGAVADEIRRLADRVTGSTREIRLLLDHTRDSVRKTVVATEIGASSVAHGARQFDRVVVAFQKIREAVIDAAEGSRSIQLSVHQQTTAIGQVNTAIAQLAEGARQSELGASQTLQTADHLAKLSLGLEKLLTSNKSTRR